MQQLTLIDETTPQACRRCGTTEPENYTEALFLEPVSGHCPTCNREVLELYSRAMIQAKRSGDPADRERADALHAEHSPPKQKRKR